MTPAERALADAAAVWQKYVNPDGTVKFSVPTGTADFAGLSVDQVVTGEMLEAARRSVDIAQRVVATEKVILADPRSATEKFFDNFRKLRGGRCVCKSEKNLS